MPTGVSPLYYPDQPTSNFNLEIDNSYFLVKLHDTQAFFQANWLAKPGLLTLSSSVESSFQPNSPTQSLHKVSTLQKNIPCQLGLVQSDVIGSYNILRKAFPNAFNRYGIERCVVHPRRINLSK